MCDLEKGTYRKIEGLNEGAQATSYIYIEQIVWHGAIISKIVLLMYGGYVNRRWYRTSIKEIALPFSDL